MAKEEKFITFAQQRHNEYLYNVFTIVLVTGCFMTISQAAFSGYATWLFGSAPNNPFVSAAKILMSATYTGVGVYLPFLFYNIIRYKSSGRFFVRGKNKTSGFVWISAIISVVGIGVFIQYLSTLAAQAMRASGFQLRETLPDIGANPVTNILFVLCTALIPTFFQEITFRGIVINSIKKDSHVVSILIAALLGSFTFTSIQQAPYLLVTGLILGWLYLKTENIFLTYTCNAILYGLLAVKWVLTCIIGRPFLQYVPVISIACGVVGVLAGIQLLFKIKLKTVHADQDKPLSRKDAAKALLRSFAFWVFIALSVFRILFGYIAKPDPNYQSPFSDSQIQQSSSNTT